MKTMLAALASASLLATSLSAVPAPADAQARGGGVRVGARGAVVSQPHFRGGGGGGFRGGYSPGWSNRGGYGGYRGGYGGYRGGYGGYWGGGAALGFALGASLAYPWYYGSSGYYAYPGYAYPGYAYPDSYVAPAQEPYPGDPWAYDYGTSQASPPSAGGQPPAQACGNWSWDANQSQYNWIPCPPSGG